MVYPQKNTRQPMIIIHKIKRPLANAERIYYFCRTKDELIIYQTLSSTKYTQLWKIRLSNNFLT
jgi:hypothetical protein